MPGSVHRSLEQFDARVTAASAAEALAALARWKPDVLVSDIAMPEASGYLLMQRSDASRPKVGDSRPGVDGVRGLTMRSSRCRQGFKPTSPAHSVCQAGWRLASWRAESGVIRVTIPARRGRAARSLWGTSPTSWALPPPLPAVSRSRGRRHRVGRGDRRGPHGLDYTYRLPEMEAARHDRRSTARIVAAELKLILIELTDPSWSRGSDIWRPSANGNRLQRRAGDA